MAAKTQRSNEHQGTSTVRLVISGILVLCLVIFVAQNLEKVTIDFLFLSVETSMLVAMLICAALGAGAALLFTRGRSGK
jgi:uncharacterized integral membrane protein